MLARMINSDSLNFFNIVATNFILLETRLYLMEVIILLDDVTRLMG